MKTDITDTEAVRVELARAALKVGIIILLCR